MKTKERDDESPELLWRFSCTTTRSVVDRAARENLPDTNLKPRRFPVHRFPGPKSVEKTTRESRRTWPAEHRLARPSGRALLLPRAARACRVANVEIGREVSAPRARGAPPERWSVPFEASRVPVTRAAFVDACPSRGAPPFTGCAVFEQRGRVAGKRFFPQTTTRGSRALGETCFEREMFMRRNTRRDVVNHDFLVNIPIQVNPVCVNVNRAPIRKNPTFCIFCTHGPLSGGVPSLLLLAIFDRRQREVCVVRARTRTRALRRGADVSRGQGTFSESGKPTSALAASLSGLPRTGRQNRRFASSRQASLARLRNRPGRWPSGPSLGLHPIEEGVGYGSTPAIVAPKKGKALSERSMRIAAAVSACALLGVVASFATGSTAPFSSEGDARIHHW